MSREAVKQCSQAIAERILGLESVREAKVVCAYAAYGNEVATQVFLDKLTQHGVRLLLPRVVGERLSWHRYSELNDLAPGAYGVPEPQPSTPVVIDPQPDVVLVPGLLFDRSGHRLGYGAGFYDRFLVTVPSSTTIGLAYEWQVVHELPCEPHDVSLSLLVTESGLCERT